MMTRMDKLARLVEVLNDRYCADVDKLEQIKLRRDEGIITNDEAIELVTLHDIKA